MKFKRPVAFKRGDRGPFIADAQEMLLKLGHDPGRIHGIFVAKTEEAVKEFQRRQGLGETGVLDCGTLKLLYDLADPGNYPHQLMEGKKDSPAIEDHEAPSETGDDKGPPTAENNEEPSVAEGDKGSSTAEDNEEPSTPEGDKDSQTAGDSARRAMSPEKAHGGKGGATRQDAASPEGAPERAIVISVGERALGLYEGGRLVRKYRVAIGRPETPTPIGRFRVLEKVVNPGGGLGTRWLGFTYEMHGIHGTNRPELIGQEVSHGCVRMHNHDVEELYDMVEVGTPVIVIGGPVESWPGMDGTSGANWQGGGQTTGHTGDHGVGHGPGQGTSTPQPAEPQTPKDPQGDQGTLNDEHIYVVQPGDTLWGISRRFGVAIDTIVRLNDIRNPDIIYPGQRLRIPRGG